MRAAVIFSQMPQAMGWGIIAIFADPEGKFIWFERTGQVRSVGLSGAEIKVPSAGYS